MERLSSDQPKMTRTRALLALAAAFLIAMSVSAVTATSAQASSPAITSFDPARAPERATVTISGSGFTGAKAVSFGGTDASFTVVDDSTITSSVPTGADSGPISVATPGGTATSSAGFIVEPNIVVILTDDQRWDTLWSMPTVQSELVDKGITFSNGFVVNPICCPSRVSFLTGQYSHTSGVWSNRGPYGGFHSFHGDSSTLATWLQAAGYRTDFVGKYLNGYGVRDTTYVPPGWSHWVSFIDNGPRYYDYTLNVDRTAVTYGSKASDYSTDVLAGYANDFLKSVPTDRPLFLFFAPFGPHTPQIPAPRDKGIFSALAPWDPPSFNEADVSDKPDYIASRPRLGPTAQTDIQQVRIKQYETLQSEDDAVGQLLQTLADRGRLDNTIVLFASDNGFLWGEHRWRNKEVPYEESIRVPFVVRWDRLASVPRTDDSLVLNADAATTFAQAAGVDSPGADGRSLFPLLDGSATGSRTSFSIEMLHYTTFGGTVVPSYCGVHTATRVFIHYETGEEEFYRLTSDPYELRNQIASPNAQAAIAQLRDEARTLCDPLPPGMPAF